MKVKTYHAVLSRNPGEDQDFYTTPRSLEGNQHLFDFEGPASMTKEDLRAYSAARFLPLHVVYYADGLRYPSGTAFTFSEARRYASCLETLHNDVRILTQDGREIWHSKMAD